MIHLENVFKYYRSQGHVKIVLDHISMHFQSGYNYGILGINGAGKSTLMRIMGGTEFPNGGRTRRTARVSWPLGFSGGLHPNLTGLENVQFVARVYGHDVRKVVEFVEDFSELGRYMHVPIKSYSSGMGQRLAFGLSMAVDFECYLIDEVTAVGDARFQVRCQTEFNKRRNRADIIMVSHDMGTLRTYCDRGLVLAHGKLHVFDNIDDAVELYKRLNE